MTTDNTLFSGIRCRFGIIIVVLFHLINITHTLEYNNNLDFLTRLNNFKQVLNLSRVTRLECSTTVLGMRLIFILSS